MLNDSRAPAFEGAAAGDASMRRSLLAGVRTRVLASFLVLLVVSTAASLFVLREVLFSRISDNVATELASQLEALTELEQGQPRTGAPWEDLESLFDEFLSRTSPPPAGAFGAFVGDTPYKILETLGDSPEEREEAIVVIQDELDRMSRYVDDLLLLTKAPRPDFLRAAPVDLDLFTHDLMAKVPSLGDRDWRVEETGVGVVVADHDRLTQAMMNLVENAVRHTHQGETISIGTSLDEDAARLWVTDPGPGVDPEDRDRIFGRFARADSSVQGSVEGAGLGLSIVQAIAEAHGGTVELDSELGVGSTFTIVLPAPPET